MNKNAEKITVASNKLPLRQAILRRNMQFCQGSFKSA